jgi:hypothetical protein
MAFTPEDGTGIEGANSYLSGEDADSYFADRGNTSWAAAEATTKMAALLEASSFLDGQYRGLWVGSLSSTTQGLAWPRTDAQDPEGRRLTCVTGRIQEAVCRVALEALGGHLSFAYDPDIQVKRKKLGPLETEFAVDTGRAPGKRFPFLDVLLGGFITAGHGMIALERV